MESAVELLSDSEAGDIFLWLGGLLLLLGFVGKLGAIIEMPPRRRNLAKIAGVVMLALGVLLERDMLPSPGRIVTAESGVTAAEPVPATVREVVTTAPEGDDAADARVPWAVILGSHTTRDDARSQLDGLLGSLDRDAGLDEASFRIIDTGEYLNLTNGYWSVILVAGSEAEARDRLDRVRGTVREAYVKRTGG